MWIRPRSLLEDLALQTQTVFDVSGDLSCSFTYLSKLECSSNKQTGFYVDTFDLENLQWLHLAVSASKKNNAAYMKIDYLD